VLFHTRSEHLKALHLFGTNVKATKPLTLMKQLEDLVFSVDWSQEELVVPAAIVSSVFSLCGLRRLVMDSDARLDMSLSYCALPNLTELTVGSLVLPHLTAPLLRSLDWNDSCDQNSDGPLKTLVRLFCVCVVTVMNQVESCRETIEKIRLVNLTTDSATSLFGQPFPNLHTFIVRAFLDFFVDRCCTDVAGPSTQPSAVAPADAKVDRLANLPRVLFFAHHLPSDAAFCSDPAASPRHCPPERA
jgi:hypothetical protein